jgi:hypothetical protein
VVPRSFEECPATTCMAYSDTTLIHTGDKAKNTKQHHVTAVCDVQYKQAKSRERHTRMELTQNLHTFQTRVAE